VSEYDHCVFYRKDPVLLIAIYVDDGIVFARDKREIDKVIRQLNNRFEVHLVETPAFLGFQIHRGTYGEIALHQTSYIRTILKRFNMEDSKPVDSPISLSSAQALDLTPLDKTVR